MQSGLVVFRRFRNPGLVWLLAMSAFALAQDAGQGQAPAVDIDTPTFQYPERVTALSKVDFKDLTYPANGDALKLRNGTFHKDDEVARVQAEFGKVWYFGSHALVSIDYVYCGGSCSADGLLFVFVIKRGHPVITQRFRYDVQVNGAGQSFDPASRKLTIKARSNDATAHCCPKQMDIASYRWTGDRFELEKFEKAPVSSK